MILWAVLSVVLVVLLAIVIAKQIPKNNVLHQLILMCLSIALGVTASILFLNWVFL